MPGNNLPDKQIITWFYILTWYTEPGTNQITLKNCNIAHIKCYRRLIYRTMIGN